MIKINLLPINLKKKKQEMRVPLSTFMAVGVVILVLLFFMSLILPMGIKVKQVKLQMVKRALEQVKPEAERVAGLKEEKEKLNKRMSIIEQLMDERILWAAKINQLSNLIPPQTWLTSLYIEGVQEEIGSKKKEPEIITRKFLVIKGAIAAGAKGRTGELKLVGDFMDKLKNDSSFSANFVNVQQRGPIRWQRNEGVNTLCFELSCQFKEGK